MNPAEVLALELRQFQGQGLKTIVPVVYGQTEEAKDNKGVRPSPRLWDESMFFADCDERNGAEAARVAEKVANWMKLNADEIVFGRGTKDGSMIMIIKEAGQSINPLSIWTYGRIEIEFQYLMKGSFQKEEKRRELLSRLNEVDAINLPADAITRRPTIAMTTLSDENQLSGFLAVMSWLVDTLRAK